MKRIIAVFCSFVLAMSMIACSNDAKKTDENTVDIVEADDVTDETNDDEDMEVNEPQTSEDMEVNEPQTSEDIKDDWLDAHGIKIESQGVFTYPIRMANDGVDADTVPASCTVTISESTDGVDEGYKKVSATFVTDMSVVGNNGFIIWHSAFDRYTGYSFEFDTGITSLNAGEAKAREGAVVMNNGIESYDVSVTFDSENRTETDGTWRTTVSVVCPVDYDGCVFYVSTSGYEHHQELTDNFNFAERLYTIDELPFFGEESHYFSYSNN